MGKKVSKKKRDAAKKAAKGDNRKNKKQNSPPASAQVQPMDDGCQDAGYQKYHPPAVYEETQVMPLPTLHAQYWCILVLRLRTGSSYMVQSTHVMAKQYIVL